jgi:hypothetical protein
MIASVGSWMMGSGTFSTLTERLPCQVSAFMVRLSLGRVLEDQQAYYSLQEKLSTLSNPLLSRAADHSVE